MQVPPLGWRYTQGNVLLVGETFAYLVKNVKAHRIANGILEGNIESDIENQIADKYPHLKRESVLE